MAAARRRQLGPRALAAACATVGAFLLGASTAHAHAFLLRSSPADGTTLTRPPRVITLAFSEAVSARLSHVQLVSSDGASIDAVSIASSSADVLAVRFPELRRGVYRLNWQTVSDDDLHVTRGALVFGVGRHASAAGPEPLPSNTVPSPTEGVLRWADFALVSGLVGALAMMTIVLPSAARRGATGLEPAAQHLAVLAAGSGLIALCTGADLLLLQASQLPRPLPEAAWEILTRTGYGPRWMAREALLAALVAIALVGMRRRPGGRLGATAMLAAVALAVSLAMVGHPSAARGQLSIATAALSLHLLSAAVWVGGLVSLAVTIRAVRRRGGAESLRGLLQAFGVLAAPAVGVLAVTGLYIAGVEVASPDALVSTVYGRVLAAKTVLFLAAGAVGVLNTTAVRRRPAIAATLLGRSIPLEAMAAALVLLPAGLMAAGVPARGPVFDPPRAQAVPSNTSLRADDLIVDLSVKPNHPGDNFVTVDVLNTRLPVPATITAVDVTATRPGSAPVELRADPVGGGRWQTATGALDRVGPWRLTIDVRRPGLPTATAATGWRTSPPTVRSPHTILSRRPLGPLLTAAAATGALLLAALALIRLGRGRLAALPSPGRSQPAARAR